MSKKEAMNSEELMDWLVSTPLTTGQVTGPQTLAAKLRRKVNNLLNINQLAKHDGTSYLEPIEWDDM